MSDGPTTVEEYLAQGGEITRERGPSVTEDGEFEWEAIGSPRPPAMFRCRRTGVLAHRRTLRNRITPYVCRHDGCSEHGTHRGYGNATYCDEHGGGE